MTDFTTPTMTRRLRFACLPFAVMASMLQAAMARSGKGFIGVLATYVRAIDLAYSAPYHRPSQPQLDASEADLDGRDPKW